MYMEHAHCVYLLLLTGWSHPSHPGVKWAFSYGGPQERLSLWASLGKCLLILLGILKTSLHALSNTVFLEDACEDSQVLRLSLKDR